MQRNIAIPRTLTARTCLLGFVLAVCFPAINADAQVTSEAARELGLEVAWRAHVQMPFRGRGIVSANVWVDQANQEKFAQVQLPKRTFRVSARQLDRDGNPIGIEGAKKLVGQQATRYLGKADGFKVEELSVPQTNLVVVTADGLVQNFDAETGKLHWSAPCGNTFAPAFPAALSAAGVAVVHGTNVYLLDWATGKQIRSVAARSKTSNAIAVAKGVGFVSDYVGNVTSYGLGPDADPWSYVMLGHAVGQSVSFANQQFCAIASDAGYVYVFTFDKAPSVWLRYETSSAIAGSLAAGNNAVYVGTTGGSISKISADSRLGSIAWEYRSSDPISAPALIDGDSVYVANEGGVLISIGDNSSGLANWITYGNVERVVGSAGDNVFCITKAKRLVAFDKASGRKVAATAPIDTSMTITNPSTNRVYVVTRDGRLVCLRPVGSELPTFVVPVQPIDETTTPNNTAPVTEGMANTDAGDNIFGGAAPTADTGDIFGTGTFGADDGGDPFDTGDGDDPFDLGDGSGL